MVYILCVHVILHLHLSLVTVWRISRPVMDVQNSMPGGNQLDPVNYYRRSATICGTFISTHKAPDTPRSSAVTGEPFLLLPITCLWLCGDVAHMYE